jgi:hypothetical protein
MRVLQKQPDSHTHMAHTNVALQADMTWWICMGNSSIELSKGAHTGETERKNERKRGTNAGNAQCKRLHMVAKHAWPHAHPTRLMPTKHNVCCGPVRLSMPPVSFIAGRKTSAATESAEKMALRCMQPLLYGLHCGQSCPARVANTQ